MKLAAQRHRERFGAAVLLATGLLFVNGAGLAQDPDAPVAVTDADDPPETPPVARLFEVQSELDAFLLSVEPPMAEDRRQRRGERLDAVAARLGNLRAGPADAGLPQLRFNDLLDLQTELRATLRDLAVFDTELESRAAKRDAELDELDRRGAELRALTEAAVTRDAPQSVLEIAAQMEGDIDRARRAMLADRDAALDELSVIARLQHAANTLDAELRRRRADLEDVSQSAADLPLWSAEVWRARLGFSTAAEAVRRSLDVIVTHVRANAWNVAGLFLVLWLSAHWLLHATGKRVEEGMQKDSTSVRGAAVFQRPSSAALLLALAGLASFGPPAPAAFNNLLSAIIPFPAAALAITVFARPIRLSIYTIAVVLAILSVKPLIDTMPLVGRFGVIAQAAVTALAVWIDYRRGRFAQALPVVRPRVIHWAVRIVFVALVLTILLEILGYVGLASTARTLVLGGLGLGMVFAALTYVVIALALALVHLGPVSHLPVVRNQRWTIVQTIRRWVRYLVMVLWALSTLSFAGLLGDVFARLQNLLEAEIRIGEITLDVSSLVAGGLILFLTWLVTSIVRFSLAAKSLSGVQVATGLTFAISKLLRYAIVVAGFLFALAAMGFDLTKVTVLAGALGIGLGFGLQNIVQNFISGLILLFERPININDIAKVDELMGTVRELNIRSTVIETFDGAEVIVPNADLVTKTVTNWTKSNRRRRAEIDVAVAYGTDPQRVLDILERVAKSYPEVSSDPEPFAAFAGFGDSSLSFRLYIWLSDLSDLLKIPSLMRQDILRELSAASIEIPFPQRDVRVTMLSGSPPLPATDGTA